MPNITIASSMISAVQWLHTNNIVHFDIKLENFMLCGESYTVNLIDFESAVWSKENTSRIYLRTTEEFVAPEFHNYRIHGFHNDIWSLRSQINYGFTSIALGLRQPLIVPPCMIIHLRIPPIKDTSRLKTMITRQSSFRSVFFLYSF